MSELNALDEWMAEFERLAHAYADEKLARYGLFGSRQLGNPEQAFAALMAHVETMRNAAPQPVGEAEHQALNEALRGEVK